MKKYALLQLLVPFLLSAQTVTTVDTYTWQNNAWQNRWHEIHEYNNGLPVYHLRKTWNTQTNNWRNETRTFPFYNENNVHYYSEADIWGNTTNQWNPWIRGYFTYTDDGKKLTETLQTVVGGVWFDWLVYTYDYDANGRLIEFVGKTYDSNNLLTNQRKSIYENNQDGSINVVTHQIQNIATGEWQNDKRESYQYNPSASVSSITTETWSPTWVVLDKMLYDYDANNFLITESRQIPIQNELITTQINEITNNEDGDRLLEIMQVMDFFQNNQWVNNTKVTYDYQTLATQTFEDANLFTLGSNPTSDFLDIHFTETGSRTSIIVSDLSGKIVMAQPSANSGKIDVSSLASGVYLLKAVQNDKSSVGKFVKN